MAATVTAAQMGAQGQSAHGSQTIEGFVGAALDDAKISPLHRKVIALIAAGYFFDVIDFTVFGSLVPFILQSKFATGAEVAAIGSATIFGMFLGTAGQGEFSDRFGRTIHLSVQPAAVRHLHDPGRASRRASRC